MSKATRRSSKPAEKEFIDESVSEEENEEDDEYNDEEEEEVSELRTPKRSNISGVRSVKRGRPTKNETILAKKTKKGEEPQGVELDISRDKERTVIPSFSVHIGDNWFIKIQDYNNKRWFVLRSFDKSGNAGKGASLPLSFFPIIRDGIEMAHKHIEAHVKTSSDLNN